MVGFGKDQKVLSFRFDLPDFDKGEAEHVLKSSCLYLGVGIGVVFLDKKVVTLHLTESVSLLVLILLNGVKKFLNESFPAVLKLHFWVERELFAIDEPRENIDFLEPFKIVALCDCY